MAATPLTHHKLVAGVHAVEADAAQAVDRDKRVTLVPASEANAAQLDVAAGGVDLTPATETDGAQPLPLLYLTPATERDEAVGIFWPAVEVDSAEPLRLYYPMGPVETDEAFPLRLYYPGPIPEADEAPALVYNFGPAQNLEPVKHVHFLKAVEDDEAQAFVLTHTISRTLTPVAEIDASAVLFTTTGEKTFKTLVTAMETD